MYDQSCEGVCSFVFIRDSMCGEDVFNEWFNPNEACFLIILPRQSLFTGHKQRFIHTHVTHTPPIGKAKLSEVFMNSDCNYVYSVIHTTMFTNNTHINKIHLRLVHKSLLHLNPSFYPSFVNTNMKGRLSKHFGSFLKCQWLQSVARHTYLHSEESSHTMYHVEGPTVYRCPVLVLHCFCNL